MSDPAPPERPASLRAEQVAQTRAALVAAGRRLFGENGFRATSVEDLAREARVTTGALYHHFPTKTALFEAVFMQAHTDLMTASTQAAQGASSDLDELARGFDAFLDGVLQPDVQRILILDGPAVLGLARFTELDERYAHAMIVHALKSAAQAGTIGVDDPDDHDPAAARRPDPGRHAHREFARPGRNAPRRRRVDAGAAEQLHSRRVRFDARPIRPVKMLMRGCWCHDASATAGPVGSVPPARHAVLAVVERGRRAREQRCRGGLPDVLHDAAPIGGRTAARRPA